VSQQSTLDLLLVWNYVSVKLGRQKSEGFFCPPSASNQTTSKALIGLWLPGSYKESGTKKGYCNLQRSKDLCNRLSSGYWTLRFSYYF